VKGGLTAQPSAAANRDCLCVSSFFPLCFQLLNLIKTAFFLCSSSLCFLSFLFPKLCTIFLHCTARHQQQLFVAHVNVAYATNSVVTTTELSPTSRWLATIEPTLPLRCFQCPRWYFWALSSENCHSLFHTTVTVIQCCVI